MDSEVGAPGEAPGEDKDDGPVGSSGDVDEAGAPGGDDVGAALGDDVGAGLGKAALLRAAAASACSRTAAVSTVPDAAVTSTTPPTSWEARQAAARLSSACA